MGRWSRYLSAWKSARISACAGLAVGAWAGNAAAAPLAYQAQLTIELANLAPVTASASGTADVAADGSFTLPASVFQVDRTATGPTTAKQIFTKASFAFHNGAGAFGGPMQPGGPMPLLGKVKLFAKPALNYPPATLTLTKAFSSGTAMAMVSNGMTALTLSLYPSSATARWLASTVIQNYTTGTSAAPFGTRTRTGYDDRTSMGVGAMNLVVPVYLDRLSGGTLQLSAPVTGSLSITFTPEPTRTALEAACTAALLLLGLSRARLRRARTS